MSRSATRPGFFERKRVIATLIALIVLICAGLAAAEFFYAKHPHFGFDGWFGFYPLVGFVAYCVIVLSAKLARPVLRRREDYYDEQGRASLKAPAREHSRDDSHE